MKKLLLLFLIFACVLFSQAAVTFDVSTSDKITVTNPQTFGSGTTFTCYMWFRRTAALDTGQGTGTNKGAADVLIWLPFGIDVYETDVGRATITADAQATTDMLPLNAWSFAAVTYSESNGIKMYKGSLTAAAVEASYLLNTVGTGATNADTGDLWVNNRTAATTASIGGELAYFFWFNREMALQEIISHQWQPRNATGCQVGLQPFATGTVHNLCGDATKNGTGTGLVLTSTSVTFGSLGF